jgi:actinin alpha
VETQAKVFSRWCTKQLQPRGLKVGDVREDFADGVKLLHLLEIAGKEPVPQKWHREVKGVRARYQALENAQAAINYIQNVKKVRLVGIQSEHIVDKNPKLTLGLVWSCINKFVIDEISVEEATARDALLIWCRKNTAGYPGVNIQDFSKSWVNGLAWCALLNKFRPALLDYSAIDTGSTDKSVHLANTSNAWAGYQALGIACLLDPEDVVGPLHDPLFFPDDKSIVTQVSELYQYFAADTKAQAQADKVKKVLQIQKQIEALTSQFEDEARRTVNAISAAEAQLVDESYHRTVQGVRAKLGQVVTYARDERPEIIDLRAQALRTWGALVTKAKAAGRVVPTPPAGLEPETLNYRFADLEATDERRTNELTQELKITEQALVDQFEGRAVSIVQRCQSVKAQADELTGDLNDQLVALEDLLQGVPALSAEANALRAPNQELVDLSLNTRAHYSYFIVESEAQQVESHLRHLIQQKTGEIALALHAARIEAYKAKAQIYVDRSREVEAEVQGVDQAFVGSLEDKLLAYHGKMRAVEEFRVQLNGLVPDYEDLERDDLHLEIEHTPASLLAFINNVSTHIVTLIQAIDQAIARQKGLQIPEEQLAEFREVFTHFDKEKNKLLEPYQLKACLTSLGEPTDDDECVRIVHQYMKSRSATGIDFDGYVAFMLDRFSKAETNDTTKAAFQTVAQNQPTITEDQLDRWFPEDAEYLRDRIPSDGAGNYAYGAYVDSIFA